MKTAEISKGGQISIPAQIRRRWHTRRLLLEDRGTEIVLRPAPEDPIAALAGSLAAIKQTSDDMRATERVEEANADERRNGSSGR